MSASFRLRLRLRPRRIENSVSLQFVWRRADSNRQPLRCERSALPIRATPPKEKSSTSGAGTRTPNLSDMSRALWPVELRRPAGCGGRIRTGNLRVMSPTSFQIAPPRGIIRSSAGSGSRTRTGFPPKDFKSLASACSAIPALSTSRRLLERETGFEPATPALARQCSTAELFPQSQGIIRACVFAFNCEGRDSNPHARRH